ncbi:MAG: MTH1187 family thiamine-binding protein [Deferrisomatales bacterium]|nr:MTH1187 family thiamine-binding protein [Deferrisomatales bacterium]
MAILEISVVPLGTGTPSLSTHLAEIPRVLAESGLRHQTHPMGTVVEGPAAELLALAGRLHEAGFAGGAQRVSTHFILDDRRDVSRPMEEKVRSLERAGRVRAGAL